eukprot:109550-Rhodomonas_salina.2
MPTPSSQYARRWHGLGSSRHSFTSMQLSRSALKPDRQVHVKLSPSLEHTLFAWHWLIMSGEQLAPDTASGFSIRGGKISTSQIWTCLLSPSTTIHTYHPTASH